MSTLDASDVLISGDKISLKKFTGGGELNILNLVKSLDIYESIYSHTLSADIYLVEGVELLNNFPLAGEELLTLSMQTPTRKTLAYDFLVDSIDDSETNNNSNMRGSVLRCATKDLLTNSFTVYTKRYKDMNYDAAVNEVITTDLGSTKSINVESTKGKFDYMVNGVRPFQVIDLIAERAVSGEGNTSSLFFFYEDNEGYNFTTLEKLIKDRKGKAASFVYNMDTSGRANRYESVINVRNILSYKIMRLGGSIASVMRGNAKMQIRELNIKTGEYYTKEQYVNTSDHASYEPTDASNDQNSSAFNGFVSARPAITRMVIKDGLRPEMEHNKNIHWKRPFENKLSKFAIHLRVYGDTDLRVGDLITLDLPEITGAESSKTQEYYSGKYIVTTLKHRLDRKSTGAFEHYMILECRKPNALKAIA